MPTTVRYFFRATHIGTVGFDSERGSAPGIEVFSITVESGNGALVLRWQRLLLYGQLRASESLRLNLWGLRAGVVSGVLQEAIFGQLLVN